LPKRLAAIQQAYSVLYSSVTDLISSFTQNRLDAIDAESKQVDAQLKSSLVAAGDNKKLQEQIQREADARQSQLDQKRKEEQRRQAQFQKDLALIQAQISLSQAIVEAYTAGPGIGQALAIATAAAGAIQIAAIAAKKIPSYEDGGKNLPGGLSRVSEKGPELLVTKDGHAYLTPDKESFIDVPKGSDIYPHDVAMKMLAMNALGNRFNKSSTGDNAIMLFTSEVRDLKRVFKNSNKNIDIRRAEKLLKSGETSIKYLTSTYK